MGRIKITELKVVSQNDGDGDELMAYALPDSGAYKGQSKSLLDTQTSKTKSNTIISINKEFDCDSKLVLKIREDDPTNSPDTGEATIDCTKYIPSDKTTELLIETSDSGGRNEKHGLYAIYYVASSTESSTPKACDFRGATIIGNPTITCIQNFNTYQILGNTTLKNLNKGDKIDVGLWDCIGEALDTACVLGTGTAFGTASCGIDLINRSTNNKVESTAKLILEHIPIINKIDDVADFFLGHVIDNVCNNSNNNVGTISNKQYENSNTNDNSDSTNQQSNSNSNVGTISNKQYETTTSSHSYSENLGHVVELLLTFSIFLLCE